MSEEYIWIGTDEALDTEGSKSWGDVRKQVSTTGRVGVSAEKVERELANLLGTVGRIFRQASEQASAESGMQLDEVGLQIEINREGQVGLMGVGGKTGDKGVINLKFKRVEPKQNGE